ncbi:MAG TPA: lysophospholipid acyltransferase family protein [Piscinibacter sp.]|jgi:1-acyl-sn-glycerol-3-phosphate acyltransferase|nr:lysophospholipid acyltransferase family protein [Piscinibacter sp.]
MNVLRSAIYVLWLAVTVVPWAILVLVYSIFVRGDRLYWFTMRWLRMAIWGARVICGVSHRIQGWENLPDSRIILCPKHQSTWETFAFPTLMPHPLCYVFKRELLLIPFFGWAMGRLDMIHIDRSRRAEAWNKVAEKGRLFMSRGSWVIMFPEGTRTPRGGQGAYKSGATRLAIATDTPVVPIAMNSARCWPRRSFVLRPGVIDISIGRPIPPAGRQPDEMMREVERWIESEMRRLDPEAYAPPAPAAQPT